MQFGTRCGRGPHCPPGRVVVLDRESDIQWLRRVAKMPKKDCATPAPALGRSHAFARPVEGAEEDEGEEEGEYFENKATYDDIVAGGGGLGGEGAALEAVGAVERLREKAREGSERAWDFIEEHFLIRGTGTDGRMFVPSDEQMGAKRRRVAAVAV